MLFSIILLIILGLTLFIIGYNFGRVKNYNEKTCNELMESYKKIDELTLDVNYYKKCYIQLLSSIDDDYIDDKIVDSRGNVVGLYFKEKI